MRQQRVPPIAVILTLFSLVIGLVIWQVIGAIMAPLVSGPFGVLKAAVAGIHNGTLVTDTAVSLGRVLAGFFIAAVLAVIFGIIIGWYKYPRMLLDPWIQFSRMIPPIALIPLVVVYLGVGETAKVFVIFFGSFLVMLVTIYQGIRQMDLTLIRASKVLGASDLVMFFRVVLPAVTPYIFTALRLGISSAWTTLVAAELISSSSGLGYMIEVASNYFQMPNIYLGITIMGIIGILMDKGVLLLQRKFTSWQEKVA